MNEVEGNFLLVLAEERTEQYAHPREARSLMSKMWEKLESRRSCRAVVSVHADFRRAVDRFRALRHGGQIRVTRLAAAHDHRPTRDSAPRQRVNVIGALRDIPPGPTALNTA
jgi:hypothetical protein